MDFTPKVGGKKYMNEYPEFGRDKSAMNVPIIIAQLLEAIVLKRREVLDRIDALKNIQTGTSLKSDSIYEAIVLSTCCSKWYPAMDHVAAIERHTKNTTQSCWPIPS